jgi:hypothetical protein
LTAKVVERGSTAGRDPIIQNIVGISEYGRELELSADLEEGESDG